MLVEMIMLKQTSNYYTEDDYKILAKGKRGEKRKSTKFEKFFFFLISWITF